MLGMPTELVIVVSFLVVERKEVKQQAAARTLLI